MKKLLLLEVVVIAVAIYAGVWPAVLIGYASAHACEYLRKKFQ